MNNLVDGTRNKVGAPPRKTRIWSGKKAEYSSENDMLSLVIWHAFFGLSGLNNDINVLQQSRLFNDPKEGKRHAFFGDMACFLWSFWIDQSFAQLYDDDAVSLCCLGILQLVILGVESRRVVPDWMLRLANDRVAWNKYPWGSYVWPTLYSQLRNANVKRWSPLYVAQPTNEDDVKTYSIFGYTWAFKTWILESFRVTAIRYFDRYNRYPRVAAWSKKKGRFLGHMVIPFFERNMPAARLTPDDNEA
ncbi:phospholipase-like protein [Tanacetum coccineum]